MPLCLMGTRLKSIKAVHKYDERFFSPAKFKPGLRGEELKLRVEENFAGF